MEALNNYTKIKKGVPSAVSDYRPIALTCVCSKIFESILSNELLSYLTKNDLITKHQYAFLKKHSTITNLLESLYDWTISFSNKKSVNVAYIDFCRAFDTISHPKIIQKLSAYGIKGTLLSWINDFLSHRTQTVKIGSLIPLRHRNQRSSSRKRPWTNSFPPFYKRHNRFYKPRCRGITFCRRSQNVHRKFLTLMPKLISYLI